MVASKNVASIYQMPWDEALYERLKKDNDEELEKYKKEEEDAEENAGETEIQAARGKRAEFYARVGDKVNSASQTEKPVCRLTTWIRTRQSPHMRQSLRRPASWAPRSIWS